MWSAVKLEYVALSKFIYWELYSQAHILIAFESKAFKIQKGRLQWLHAFIDI